MKRKKDFDDANAEGIVHGENINDEWSEEELQNSPLGFLLKIKRAEMNAQDEKKISDAVDIAWSLLIDEPQPEESPEEAGIWSENKLLYWKKRVELIKPFSSLSIESRSCVYEAIKIWMKYEEEFFQIFECDWNKIFNLFHLYRKSFFFENKRERPDLTNPIGYLERYFFFRNIQTIHAFSWLFPASDPSYSEVYKLIGKAMIIVFYMERIEKFISHFASEENDLKNLLDPKQHESFYNVEFEYLAAFGDV